MNKDNECSSLTWASVISSPKELKMVPFVQAELLGDQVNRPVAPVSSSLLWHAVQGTKGDSQMPQTSQSTQG